MTHPFQPTPETEILDVTAEPTGTPSLDGYRTVAQLAREFETTPTSVQRWVKKAETQAGRTFTRVQRGKERLYSPTDCTLIIAQRTIPQNPVTFVEPEIVDQHPQPAQLAHLSLSGLTGFERRLTGGAELARTEDLCGKLDQVIGLLRSQTINLDAESQAQLEAARLQQSKVRELEAELESTKRAADRASLTSQVADLLNHDSTKRLELAGLLGKP